MAILIPSLGYARFDSRGELRLAERLKDFLEENAVVWHNLPVGPRNRPGKVVSRGYPGGAPWPLS